MAQHQAIKHVTLEAGEDLNDSQFEAVTINANGQVVKADAVTEVIFGFLVQNTGKTEVGDAVTVAVVTGGGIAKAKASAAIVAGHLIIPTVTDGKVAGVANTAALAANQVAVGVALEAAAGANEIIPVLLQPIAKSA